MSTKESEIKREEDEKRLAEKEKEKQRFIKNVETLRDGTIKGIRTDAVMKAVLEAWDSYLKERGNQSMPSARALEKFELSMSELTNACRKQNITM